MGPVVQNDDLLHPQLNWQTFDQRFGPLLDGSAFPDRKPLDHFYLPFNPNWPAPFSLYFQDRSTYEAIWKAFAQAFIQHFKEKGWTKTTFQVYCNQKPNPKNKIPWHLDEPKGVEDYKALRYYEQLAHRVFANAVPVKVRFRLDISHFYCEKHRGNPKKDFRVNKGNEILKNVDIWVISYHSLKDRIPQEKAQLLLKAGKQVWMYGNTPPVEGSGFLPLKQVFLAYNNHWNGLVVWKTFAFQPTIEKSQNCAAYVLQWGKQAKFYPSLRMVQFKHAIEIIQFLEWAHAQGMELPGSVHDILHRLITAEDEEVWLQFYRFLNNLKQAALK